MSITSGDIAKTEEIVSQLLQMMHVKMHAEVAADTAGLKVRLNGKDSAIMIGRYGETLADFSYLVSLMVRNTLGKEVAVRVDAGDYLKEKDRRIKGLAQSAIKRVISGGQPETIEGLNSYERRIVHGEANKEGLESASEGEGHDRRIVIMPRD